MQPDEKPKSTAGKVFRRTWLIVVLVIVLVAVWYASLLSCIILLV
jgi:hypothetical protein